MRVAAAYDQGDYTTALQHWRPLAEQGHASAQYNLGVMYWNGKGIRRDYVEAVKWWRKAAEQGNTNAQANLGGMYVNGDGVNKDYVTAYMWFTLAAAQGNENASNALTEGTSMMTSSQIAEAQRRARNWKPVEEQPKPALTSTSQRQKPSTPAPVLPPVLSIEEITFSEGVLDAEETATLSIRIKNIGPGDAHNLTVKLSSTSQGFTFPVSTTVSTIPKQGGEKTVNIQIKGTLDLPIATAALDIQLSEVPIQVRDSGQTAAF